ncbi:hypothetical protein BDM02DRAFT_3132508 [Thelephora ganbajun]|uniref:Uncharacterized protein n=1 Tax=Thelephora ganbajun TaxID=370292 RepID=A0ACB6Z1D6_THEGA|nr:hypothetical protein BDM02DRAFT_3132508 [Thelephora ganbajun]
MPYSQSHQIAFEAATNTTDKPYVPVGGRRDALELDLRHNRPPVVGRGRTLETKACHELRGDVGERETLVTTSLSKDSDGEPKRMDSSCHKEYSPSYCLMTMVGYLIGIGMNGGIDLGGTKSLW